MRAPPEAHGRNTADSTAPSLVNNFNGLILCVAYRKKYSTAIKNFSHNDEFNWSVQVTLLYFIVPLLREKRTCPCRQPNIYYDLLATYFTLLIGQEIYVLYSITSMSGSLVDSVDKLVPLWKMLPKRRNVGKVRLRPLFWDSYILAFFPPPYQKLASLTN
jgi:hypothetical protein